MPAGESELVYVVPGASTGGLVDALSALGDDAADRSVRVDVRVVVETEREATVVRDRIERDLSGGAVTVTVETDPDPVGRVADRIEAGATGRVLAGPDTDAASRLADAPTTVTSLPGDRDRSGHLVRDRRAAGFALTFVLSYGFYLALGDPMALFDLVTGAVVAGVVAATLSAVVVEPSPSVAVVAAQSLRATLFLPYLLVEIVRANLGVAYVILHPSLPIDPAFVTYDPGIEGPLERAVLGNAITLTPGTVTVDVGRDGFLVHTLTPATREGLREGSLARAVAWVFHGRDR